MKLYVGNLPWSVDNSQLEELFSEFGSVISANVAVSYQQMSLRTEILKDQEALALLN